MRQSRSILMCWKSLSRRSSHAAFREPPPRQLMDLPRRRCSSRPPGSTPDRAFSNWTRTPSLMDVWFPRGTAVRAAGLSVAVNLVGETKVAIVNPENLTKCRADEIGEIWVSDPAVAAGYWNQPAKSQEIFGAYLKDTGEGPWLRTGDLGFLQNGELFISGRLKDMIIIRGANFAPQDIEWVSQKCHPAVESAESAAFSLTIDGEESLGVVQELNRKDHPSNIDFEDVAARIREQISLEFEVRAYAVALVRRGTIPKTSSGKIQRRACRAALLDGSLETLFVLNDGPLS